MSVFRDKRTGGWMVKFLHQGEQIQKKGFGVGERDKAKEWEANEKKRLKTPPPALISIGMLVGRYIAFTKARMQINTWRAKLHYYQQLIGALGSQDVPAESVTKINIHDFLEQVAANEGTTVANRHLKDFKAMWNWGTMNDLVRTNPCKGIQPFPEKRAVKYVPPPEDIDKVLMAAGQEDMDLLICLYHTGGRIGEIFRLTWDDVNLEKRSVTLWTRKRRGGELQDDKLAMSEKLHSVLQRRWQKRDKDSPFVFCGVDGSPLRYSAKRDLMRDLCEKAKVKPFGFHAIRHHVASIIADRGKATLGQIQKFLRHRRQSTTEGYLHELTRDQREIAKMLDEDTTRDTTSESSAEDTSGTQRSRT